MAITYYASFLTSTYSGWGNKVSIYNVVDSSKVYGSRPLTTSTNHLRKDDLMINTASGAVYKCVTDGYVFLKGKLQKNRQYAQFEKTRVDPILRPSPVRNLVAPSRGSGYEFSTKWTAANTDSNSAYRPTHCYCAWYVNWRGGYAKKTFALSPGDSSSSVNLTDFEAGAKITRDYFYPLTTRYVTSIASEVFYENNARPERLSKKVKTSLAIKIPRKPTIGDFVFNKDNGEVTFHIKTNEGTDRYERYDTEYYVWTKWADNTWHENWHTSSTSTDISRTLDFQNYAGIAYSQYYAIKVTARSRGLAGASEWVDAFYYIGFPALATIKSFNVSGKDLESRLTVRLATNSTKEHFVEQVKLEYLPDVTYATASEIPGSAEWSDSGLVDDAQCTALSVSVQELIPSAGKYTWFRLKTWCRNEDVLYRYTAPQRLKALETPAPTAADERISILQQVALSEADNDGQTLVLRLGWNKNGKDDADGTELTWSTNKNAWRSTQEPNKYEFDWSDGKLTYNKVTYQDSATIYLYELEEGVPVFFKARRYLTDENDNTTYSPYSNTFSATPHRKPDPVNVNVSVVSDSVIPANKSFPVSWQYDSELKQTGWQIIDNRKKSVIASASNARTAHQIAASRLAAFAYNNAVSFYVQVRLGTAWYKSAVRSVSIVKVPTISISAISTLTAQPLSFAVTANQTGRVRVIVTSRGVSGQMPEGIKRQADDDVIYSAERNPSWKQSGSNYTANISLPSRLDFMDNGSYEVQCVLINAHDMESTPYTRAFSVAWAYQAANVTNSATITPINETASDGTHRQAVSIKLSVPSGSTKSSDVYDIYRLTGDGATLIKRNCTRTATVVDEYAPFGETPTYYRVALRTVDGDVSFADINYHLDGDALRFDWEDQSVEIPYNISIQDSYEKDVEVRKHLDGTQDGYWNESIARKASLSGVLVTLDQQTQVDQMRALARYAGPVFVRTPDGSAYMADVQVTDITPTADKYVSFSISATELDLTENFMAE